MDAGETEEEDGEGVDTGLLLRASPPVVAQPAINEQHALNASQKVADLFDSRIVKNLLGSRQCR